MKKSTKIIVGLFLFIIACGVATYLFLMRETLDLEHQIYWLIGCILDISAFFVVVFLVKTEKKPESEDNQPQDDIPLSEFKISKKNGKRMMVRKNPDRYEYEKESNTALTIVRWLLIFFFLGLVFFVGYFYT